MTSLLLIVLGLVAGYITVDELRDVRWRRWDLWLFTALAVTAVLVGAYLGVNP